MDILFDDFLVVPPATSLASWSSFKLPVILVCARTHWILTQIPCCTIRCVFCLITLAHVWLGLLSILVIILIASCLSVKIHIRWVCSLMNLWIVFVVMALPKSSTSITSILVPRWYHLVSLTLFPCYSTTPAPAPPCFHGLLMYRYRQLSSIRLGL